MSKNSHKKCNSCLGTGLYDKWDDGEKEPCIDCSGTGRKEKDVTVQEEPNKVSDVETSIEDKVAILADLWMNYRDDEDFTDFVQYNDLGLPLAYAIDNEIVEMTPSSRTFIEETFSMLLDLLEVDPSEGPWETLDDVIAGSYDS